MFGRALKNTNFLKPGPKIRRIKQPIIYYDHPLDNEMNLQKIKSYTMTMGECNTILSAYTSTGT